MIQAEYVKTGICNGCGVVGCLLIRADIPGMNQASSIRLCQRCFQEAKVEVGQANLCSCCENSDCDCCRDCPIHGCAPDPRDPVKDILTKGR